MERKGEGQACLLWEVEGWARPGGSTLGRGRSEAGKKDTKQRRALLGPGTKLWGCLSVCPPPAIIAASLTFGAGTSVCLLPSSWPRLL